jgi:hypothetical protein
MIISANGTRTFRPAPGRRYVLSVDADAWPSGVSVAVNKVGATSGSETLDTFTANGSMEVVGPPSGQINLVTTGLGSGETLTAGITKIQ